ncbi:MAG: NAD-dependent dehydratase [Archangium gephyra]|uniref:NAD-dependent dehydratase n=1 Tax=Archangium gephyra TaxID=48 RepID=A0A2W5TL16_9BACT|nr:MAG: NAD-dependent dehydratase [Archangium gephyra]
MKQVLITGGAGFIGCLLAERLLKAGVEVVVFDNLHPQVHTEPGVPSRLPKGARLVLGDVCSADNWRSLFHTLRPDAIVHLAAETGTGQSLTQSHRHASVNVVGTSLMLDALTAVKHVPSRMLLSSSRAVYGDGAWRDSAGQLFYPPGRSRSQLEAAQWDYLDANGKVATAVANDARIVASNPISVYGATKLAQEHMLSAWSRAFGSALTVLRFQNVYGAGQAIGNPYTGVLTFFATQARAGKPIDIYEDGKIIRDFVHVQDVVSAVHLALAREGGHPTAIDIGCGEATDIAYVAKMMAKLGGVEARVTGRFRDGDVRAAWASIEQAQSVLGYKAAVPLETGLRELLDSVPSR